jgi:DNA-directed RNA polymerase subunit alpha
VKVFSEEVVILKINKKGLGPVTAGDIEPDGNVEVMNKDLLICNITDKSKPFEMEIAVGQGRGFKPVEEKDRKSYDLGTIVVDSVYTPVKDVGYHVEYTRVGDITNYEKLTIDVRTNGTMDPQDAVRQSTQILMDHFSIVLDASNGASMPEMLMPAKEDVVEETVVAEGTEATEEPKKKKKAAKKK